jgi:hypothetical protein
MSQSVGFAALFGMPEVGGTPGSSTDLPPSTSLASRVRPRQPRAPKARKVVATSDPTPPVGESDDIPAGQPEPATDGTGDIDLNYTDEEWSLWFDQQDVPATPEVRTGGGLDSPRLPTPGIPAPATPTVPDIAPGHALVTIASPKTPLGLEMPGLTTNDMRELDRPRCCKCKVEVCPLRAFGKSSGSWRCNQCNSKCVALYKKFGQWPIESFKGFSEKEQVDFYNDIKNKGINDVEQLLINKMVQVKENYESNEHKGDWLPLSVWGSRGYDMDAIRDTATAENSKPCKRFGALYRVFIESDAKGSKDVNQRIEEVRANVRKVAVQKKEAIAKDSRGKKLKHVDEHEGDEAQRKKARAANEKEELRLAQQEAQRTKTDTAKRQRLALILATKTIAKCTSLQDDLAELMKDKGMKLFQGWVVEKIKAAKDDVDRIQKESKVALAKKSGDLSFTMEDVQAIATSATETIKLGSGMLKTVKGLKL